MSEDNHTSDNEWYSPPETHMCICEICSKVRRERDTLVHMAPEPETKDIQAVERKIALGGFRGINESFIENIINFGQLSVLVEYNISQNEYVASIFALQSVPRFEVAFDRREQAELYAKRLSDFLILEGVKLTNGTSK